jgi:hypothetical protein
MLQGVMHSNTRRHGSVILAAVCPLAVCPAGLDGRLGTTAIWQGRAVTRLATAPPSASRPPPPPDCGTTLAPMAGRRAHASTTEPQAMLLHGNAACAPYLQRYYSPECISTDPNTKTGQSASAETGRSQALMHDQHRLGACSRMQPNLSNQPEPHSRQKLRLMHMDCHARAQQLLLLLPLLRWRVLRAVHLNCNALRHVAVPAPRRASLWYRDAAICAIGTPAHRRWAHTTAHAPRHP